MKNIINLAAVLVCVCASLSASARDITFDDRLAAQKAIEQVYWSHRVWPKENLAAKPPLSAVMPDTAIRAKVEGYLAQSNALERWWRRPITADQLQAELERMTKNTQDGALLNELFRTLGNDAELIAETLARQTLADRLIRNWYGSDTRFHAETKARAEAARARCERASCLKAMSGDYNETTWVRSDDRSRRLPDPEHRTVAVEDWNDRLNRLATRFGVRPGSVPVGRVGPLEETEDGFSVTAVLAQRDGELTTASVVWPKRSFESWWDDARGAVGSTLAQPTRTFALPSAAPSTPCTNDTWRRTHYLAPDSRSEFNAVWTGTEMIVWGGTGTYGQPLGSLFNGGRYNPSTDTWTSIPPSPNGPLASWYSTAVWTGTEMIVFGGNTGSQFTKAGARYNPTTGTWTRISTGANCPAGRFVHSAVWTGTEMIIWGGWSAATQFENTGGRYNPSTDTWTPTSTAGQAPVGRYGHSAVWTGTEMIIWGGEGGDETGGRYNPSTDTWTATSTGTNVPSERYYHSAVWTGTRMLIWGGEDDGVYNNTGGRYNPSTNSWAAISTGANAPSVRTRSIVVWTGTEMIVWGGYNLFVGVFNTGGRYNPTNNTWAPTSTGANVPAARDYPGGVWTGSEMIVWGGVDDEGQLSTGARYSPSSNTWVPMTPGAGVPERGQASQVWTGSEMVVWSGLRDISYVTNSGGRYNPSLDTWTGTSLASGVPSARTDAKATWTGTEMLVWGGRSEHADLNTGGRYNPASDTWTATSTGANVPSPRLGFSSVWTGTEMVVWGGQDSSSIVFNDGARYNPANNTWTPTSVGANVPEARSAHSAVWSGSEMIVWGGQDSSFTPFNDGARYSPANNTWTPTSVGANVPEARSYHSAVWSGSEMLVWGGAGGSELNTGGRYDPASDGWSPTSIGANLPTARLTHSAVWTGEEMIVWGGNGPSPTPFNTGGRYKPLSDSWTPTSTGENVPPARSAHSAVWTGTEMIVWGGRPEIEQGGVYCACPNGIGVFYRDLDGDGHGSAAQSQSACAQPSGFVASADDCNDGEPAVYAGAPELNDGLDNQCPGGPGYGIVDEIADTLHVNNGGVVSWTDTSGAATFDVARSPSRNLSPCEIIGTANSGSPSVTDATTPPSGGGFYYLVRAASAHVGSWGQNSAGVERTLSCP